MKIASSTWSFHPWLLSGKTSIRELAEKGASLGLDGYEIVDIDLPDTSESGIRSIRPIMSDYGMAISCVSIEHDLSQLSEAAWQADIDKVYQWMEYSLILGTPKLRVFTGWQKQGMTYLEQVKNAGTDCLFLRNGLKTWELPWCLRITMMYAVLQTN